MEKLVSLPPFLQFPVQRKYVTGNELTIISMENWFHSNINARFGSENHACTCNRFLRIFQTGLAYKKKENQINQPVSFEIPSRKNEDNYFCSLNGIH